MTSPPTSRLRIDVFTIFPELIDGYCSVSIVGRARRAGILDLRAHDLREGATDAHRSVDDAPFGGGAGMVLSPEPVFAAIEQVDPPRPLYLLSAAGQRFDQPTAARLAGLAAESGSAEPARPGPEGPGPAGVPGGTGGAAPAGGQGDGSGFSLLCGRYEGVDERIATGLVDGELSVGDYVLAGGELAALVVVEAVTRLLPGALGNLASSAEDSFSAGLLEYPQYTRPAEFRGEEVPEVLRSGDHRRVERWRLAESLHRTLERRPDLIERRGGVSEAEAQLLAEHGYPLGAAEYGVAIRHAATAGAAPPEERELR